QVLDAKAQAGDVVAERGEIAARRFQPIVAPVIEQDLADRRGQVRSCLQLNEQRGIALDVGDVVRAAGVFPGLSQVLGDLVASAQRTAIGKLLIDRRHAGKEIGSGTGFYFKYVNTRSDVFVEEIGFGKAEIDLLRAERDDGADADVL